MHQTTEIFWHLPSSVLTKLSNLWAQTPLFAGNSPQGYFFTWLLRKVSKQSSRPLDVKHGLTFPTEKAYRNKYAVKQSLDVWSSTAEALLGTLTCCYPILLLCNVETFNLYWNYWLCPQLPGSEGTEVLTWTSNLIRLNSCSAPVQHSTVN